ncbi:MAG: PAS domain S-box protein [Planctomycetota bacterium]|nr:MAG: PAS domain S-box protein [Planctomycetota bacterium]
MTPPCRASDSDKFIERELLRHCHRESCSRIASQDHTMIAPSIYHPQAELEQMIAELEALDDWNSQVMAETEIGVFDWPLRSHELYLSPIFKRMLGYSDHELPDSLQAWLSHIHADDYDRVTSALDHAVRSGARKFQTVHRAKHRDGTTPLFLIKASIVRSSQGTPTRMLGAVIDLTSVTKELPVGGV